MGDINMVDSDKVKKIIIAVLAVAAVIFGVLFILKVINNTDDGEDISGSGDFTADEAAPEITLIETGDVEEEVVPEDDIVEPTEDATDVITTAEVETTAVEEDSTEGNLELEADELTENPTTAAPITNDIEGDEE